MEKGMIDRIVDGNKAVLLVGDKEVEYIIDANRLPAGAKEGDWLKAKVAAGAILKLELDPGETATVRHRIEAKMALLKKRNGSRFKK